MKKATGRFKVTGGLVGIVGNGTWHAGPGPEATFELSYELP